MISRRLRILRATSFALLMIGLAVGHLAQQAGRDAATPALAAPAIQERSESPCTVVSRSHVEPSIVLKGETVSVTLYAQAICPGVIPLIHVVLVLDGSAAMSGEPNRELKAAMRNLVQRLALKDNPGIQVGVVSHANGSATSLCRLSNRSGTVNGCIGRVGSAGAPDLDGAIDEARQMLTLGRQGIEDLDALREIVFVASGAPIAGNGCSDVQRSAGQLKNQGVLVMTSCAANGCDEQCLRQTATSPRYYFDDLDGQVIGNVFSQVIRLVSNTLIRGLIITETLGAGVTLVADSAQPQPNEISPENDQLVWRTSFVPREGITLSFQALPTRLGPHTMASALGSFIDNQSRHGAFALPPQSVMVLAPDPVFTATPEDPEPNATPVPEGTPTALPEDPPTPEVREHLNFLPLVIRSHDL